MGNLVEELLGLVGALPEIPNKEVGTKLLGDELREGVDEMGLGEWHMTEARSDLRNEVAGIGQFVLELFEFLLQDLGRRGPPLLELLEKIHQYKSNIELKGDNLI